MVWRLEMLPAAFERGLAIPARFRLLRDGASVALRSDVRRRSAFREHFRDVAFARVEMRAAIQRLVPARQRAELLKSLGEFSQVPEMVGESFHQLCVDFEQITMAICHEPTCEYAHLRHAHAYRRGQALPYVTIRSRVEAKAWVQMNRLMISSVNEMALMRRIGDWPGMPEGPPKFFHLGV